MDSSGIPDRPNRCFLVVLPGRGCRQTEPPPHVQGGSRGELHSLNLSYTSWFLLNEHEQEGLSCSPNHWPCLENLMVVSFKLDDNMGCLTYCELALERDPEHQKAKLYKSKVMKNIPCILFHQYCPQVYNEMPFLREALNDMAFIPQHTELESYYYLPPPPKVPLQPILTVLHEILLYDCFSMNI